MHKEDAADNISDDVTEHYSARLEENRSFSNGTHESLDKTILNMEFNNAVEPINLYNENKKYLNFVDKLILF